jgi:hypothetical protein
MTVFEFPVRMARLGKNRGLSGDWLERRAEKYRYWMMRNHEMIGDENSSLKVI